MAHHHNPDRHRGFTLVELLVVVGVIALLIGILVPALSSARESARLAASMSNMRQITVAAVNYSVNNADEWCVIPLDTFQMGPNGELVRVPTPRNGNILFNSWNWGGKTSDTYWNDHGPVNYVIAKNRVLNPWVYPDLEITERVSAKGLVKNEKRMEFEIFRCPSDTASYQRGFWAKEPEPFIDVSSYDDVGTSYHLNVKWWYAMEDRYKDTALRWQKAQPMFRRGGLGGPSKFVWCHDQTMDVLTHHADITQEGVHRGENRAKAAFMDGHVTYLTVKPGEPVTSDYWLYLE